MSAAKMPGAGFGYESPKALTPVKAGTEALHDRFNMRSRQYGVLLASGLIAAGLVFPRLAYAHCDSMDGPVVHAAKLALTQKDVRPVLKWVPEEAEPEIQAAFARTLSVRTESPAARELADQFFFETLVRVHRAGEGAPFTGLKPAGTRLSPAIEEADMALVDGRAEKLIKLITDEAAAGIRQRLAAVEQRKKHAEESVDAGREYVAAYVDYVHYVEAVQQAAAAGHARHAQQLSEAHSRH